MLHCIIMSGFIFVTQLKNFFKNCSHRRRFIDDCRLYVTYSTYFFFKGHFLCNDKIHLYIPFLQNKILKENARFFMHYCNLYFISYD